VPSASRTSRKSTRKCQCELRTQRRDYCKHDVDMLVTMPLCFSLIPRPCICVQCPVALLVCTLLPFLFSIVPSPLSSRECLPGTQKTPDSGHATQDPKSENSSNQSSPEVLTTKNMWVDAITDIGQYDHSH
jgi:hypothetical protein